jgi:copper homeostasis protein
VLLSFIHSKLSTGLLKVVKDNLPLPIFVVVRPYRIDYCYSESEFEIMKEEISIAKHVGANGFVLGILTQ